MRRDLSIIVVTYECRDEARECLRSVEQDGSSLDREVIVLDNASSDGTAEMIRTEFPAVRLLAEPENLGFARGVNRAADAAEGEYLLLLNPDTIVHPGATDALVHFARAHPEHGLYGGRTVNPDGTVHPGSCWGRPTLWSLVCFATLLSTAFSRSRLFDPESLGSWPRDTVREVDIVTGCLLLASRTLWSELGGFDERFFVYGEDADLALRAARLGYRPAITPDAVVTHEIGASSASRPDKFTLVFRAKATLIRKHWRPPKRDLGIALLWLGVGIRALLVRLRPGSTAAGTSASMWPAVWQARGDWLAGFAEQPARRAPASAA